VKPVLITGFEAFGGATFNPSAEIVSQLDGTAIAARSVVGAILPCVFASATVELMRLVESHDPALVICLGVAVGRTAITPERVAINVADARIPDNSGYQPVDQPVVSGGPAAYWTALPIKAIVAALRARGIPAEVSQTAGTFVCNHVFYALMHARARARGRFRSGFIHVPALANTAAGQPGLPLAVMTAAIHQAVETSLAVRRDIRQDGGAAH
jgi:pyroglutamyl-peptidase